MLQGRVDSRFLLDTLDAGLRLRGGGWLGLLLLGLSIYFPQNRYLFPPLFCVSVLACIRSVLSLF